MTKTLLFLSVGSLTIFKLKQALNSDNKKAL